MIEKEKTFTTGVEDSNSGREVEDKNYNPLKDKE